MNIPPNRCSRLALTAGFILLTVAATAKAATPAADGLAVHQDQLAASAVLTLPEVVEHAYDCHPLVQRIQAQAAEARAWHTQAGTWLSSVPAAQVQYQSDQAGSGQGLTEWQAGVELPLWLPGQRRARLGVAESSGSAADAATAGLKLQIAGDVRKALWELLLSDNERMLAKQAYEGARALEHDVQHRHDAGELPKSSLLLAQDETLQRHDAFLTADAELNHASQRYRALTGLDTYPAEFRETRSAKTTITPDHPRLAAAQALVARTKAQATLVDVETGVNPQLGLNVRRERGSLAEDSIASAGISLSLPFATAPHNAVENAQAQQAVSAAQSERDLLRRELELALHEAEHQITVTKAELALAETRNGIAQEGLRMARIAFEAGETDLAELLRAKARAFAAERTLNQYQLRLYRHTAEYNQAVGDLP